MPSASELYGGQWLKATDLNPVGRKRIAFIHEAAPELVGQDQKQMLGLALAAQNGAPWPKKLLLNKGNMLQLVVAYGDDYSRWIGRPIEIWSENVMFQGRMVPGIKVLPAPSARTAPPPVAAPPSSTHDDMPPDAEPDSAPPISEDEIPF